MPCSPTKAYVNVHLVIDALQPEISEHQTREIAMEHRATVGLTEAVDRRISQLVGGIK